MDNPMTGRAPGLYLSTSSVTKVPLPTLRESSFSSSRSARALQTVAWLTPCDFISSRTEGKLLPGDMAKSCSFNSRYNCSYLWPEDTAAFFLTI